MSQTKISDYNNHFSILVATSDKYISLMDGFFKFFKKNWPDNPFQVYVSLEKKSFNAPKNVHLVSTLSKDWSKRIFNTLKKINTEYVIVLLDDYWIMNKIDDETIKKICDFTLLVQPDYMSYLDNPVNYYHQIKKYKEKNEIVYYEVLRGDKFPYFIGAGYIYSTKFLQEILRRNETAWDFELNASYRYTKYNRIRNFRFHMKKDPFNYLYGGIILKGEIRPEAKAFLKSNSVNLNWVNQRVNASTLKTPLFIRFFRKLIRGPKRFLSRYFFKF